MLSDCAQEAEAGAMANGSKTLFHDTNNSFADEAVLHFENKDRGMKWTTLYFCSS
jgi:hypothetical protein